jgi:molecular chaperone DnaK
LSREEIDNLIKDAELHAEDDRRKKELVDARNTADGLIHATEKTLAEQAEKVDPATRAEIERAVADLKRAAEGDNVDEIKRLTETLTHASHALAQAMYQQAGPQAGPGNGQPSRPSAAGGDDAVVDAEYEEVA